MDEALREESYTAGWKISASMAARIFIILLGIILAGNPVLREMTQDFLNAPVIPKGNMETEGNASVRSKQEGKVSKPDKTDIKAESELVLSNTISDDEALSDQLLMADAIPEMPLQLPYISDEMENSPAEVLAEVIPEVQEMMPDQSMPENVSDITLVPFPDVPKLDDAVTESMPDDFRKVEITAPEPDITVTETPTDDMAKTEVIWPKPDTSVTGEPADDTVKAEVNVPKEDTIVPGNPEEDSTVSDVIVSDPSGTDPVISDPVLDDPSIPEPIVPDTGNEGSGSDVTGEVPTDTVEDNGEAKDAVSCFLLDDAGMLYGFLPEYAEIQDGCLTLPEECTGIRSGAFLGCGAVILELYIPVGTVTIEEGAFAGLDCLEWIEVDSGNPGCASDSGVLFDSSMSVLLAFPSAWAEGYAVPRSVTRIAGRAFDHTSISMLDVRACGVLSFGDQIFGNSTGSGIKVITSIENQPFYEEMLSEYEVEVGQ